MKAKPKGWATMIEAMLIQLVSRRKTVKATASNVKTV